MASKVKQWLLNKCTLLFLLIYYTTASVERKQLKLLDEPVWVYEFESNSDTRAQVTPFNTIIWNKHANSNLSENAKRLVLRHEKSHHERSPLFKGLFYGTLLWMAIGVLVTVGGIVSIAAGNYAGGATLVGTGVLLMAVFGVIFRIDETLADYHTLNELGESEFISAYSEVSEQSNPSALNRLIGRLFYTSPKNTVALRRAIHAIAN